MKVEHAAQISTYEESKSMTAVSLEAKQLEIKELTS
jgi:hypothetical protein